MEYTEFQDERNDGKVLHANDSGYQESFFESDFANQTMDMLKTNSDATECKGKRYQMIMLRISINVRSADLRFWRLRCARARAFDAHTQGRRRAIASNRSFL